MKRVVICAAIISVIILSSIGSLFILKTQNEKIIEYVDEAILLWKKNETGEALEKIDELNRFWQKYYIRISFIVQNDKMENINTSVAKLKPLVITGNEEFYAECENIKLLLEMIYDSQFPYLHSII